MSHVFLEMSMTLDGFTAGHGASIYHPLGIDGECVHEWIRNSVFHGAVPSDDRPRVVDRLPDEIVVVSPALAGPHSRGADAPRPGCASRARQATVGSTR